MDCHNAVRSKNYQIMLTLTFGQSYGGLHASEATLNDIGSFIAWIHCEQLMLQKWYKVLCIFIMEYSPPGTYILLGTWS